jgi:hypothetical protein
MIANITLTIDEANKLAAAHYRRKLGCPVSVNIEAVSGNVSSNDNSLIPAVKVLQELLLSIPQVSW